MITAEVAVYPLKTANASDIITNSINTLQGTNLSYDVNSINTKLYGTNEEVFKSLKTMFDQAENSGGEINMVVTISNAS